MQFGVMVLTPKIFLEDSYSYLGVIFNYNSSFVKARSKLMDEARKAYIVCIENSVCYAIWSSGSNT
jgi:hypothetical protein